MALINNIYVFVEEEHRTEDTESSSHPVEKGDPITDHVKRKPIELSVKGKIVNTGKVKAGTALTNLRKLQRAGSLVKWVGKTTLNNVQIQSFTTSYPNTTWGGCDFEMTLQEVRIAKAAYTPPAATSSATPKKAGTQQTTKGSNKKVYHTVKKGECVWNLVSKKYKTLYPKYSSTQKKCDWVMKNNPKAFSKYGDFRTLQVGKKLYIGYRK